MQRDASPDASPFLVEPALLPRLVRYLNHHPVLSYLFAPAYVGAASQSPRPDEGTRDAFRELAVALDQLERRQEPPSPESLWASLGVKSSTLRHQRRASARSPRL